MAGGDEEPKREVEAVLQHLRLTDADRDTYGGAEWVTYDWRWLEDLPAGELIAIEREIARAGDGKVALLEAARDIFDASAMGIKLRLFLARRAAGLLDTWATFNPKLGPVRTRTEVIWEDGTSDVDPPDHGSAALSTSPVDDQSPIG